MPEQAERLASATEAKRRSSGVGFFRRGTPAIGDQVAVRLKDGLPGTELRLMLEGFGNGVRRRRVGLFRQDRFDGENDAAPRPAPAKVPRQTRPNPLKKSFIA